jgi:hypothetical protein
MNMTYDVTTGNLVPISTGNLTSGSLEIAAGGIFNMNSRPIMAQYGVSYIRTFNESAAAW